LHEPRDVSAVDPIRLQLAAHREGSEGGTLADPSRLEPSTKRIHGTKRRGTQLPDGDFAAGTELIGLRAPQLDDGPALFEATIGNVERGNFRPSKCTGNGEEKKCAIAAYAGRAARYFIGAYTSK